MNKKLIALIAAGLLAVLGVGAVALYAKGAENRAFDQASLTDVLVVRAAVPAGAQASKLGPNVELKRLPKVSIAQGAVTDLADLGDVVTNGPLAPGDQVTTNRFSATDGEDGATGADAATEVPAGYQVLEIAVAAPRVPSSVKTGSTVGMIGTYSQGDGAGNGSRMFLSKVRVIGVAATNDNSGNKVLRLAVTTVEAQKITNMMEYGKLWLTDQDAKTDVAGVPTTLLKDVIQ